MAHIAACVAYFSRFGSIESHRRFRPRISHRPLTHPREWWAFAIAAVRWQIQLRDEPWSWARISLRAKQRRAYVALQREARRRGRRRLTDADAVSLSQLSDALSAREIFLFDQLAEAAAATAHVGGIASLSPGAGAAAATTVAAAALPEVSTVIPKAVGSSTSNFRCLSSGRGESSLALGVQSSRGCSALGGSSSDARQSSSERARSAGGSGLGGGIASWFGGKKESDGSGSTSARGEVGSSGECVKALSALESSTSSARLDETVLTDLQREELARLLDEGEDEPLRLNERLSLHARFLISELVLILHAPQDALEQAAPSEGDENRLRKGEGGGMPPFPPPPPRPARLQATISSVGLNLGISPSAYSADVFCKSIEAELHEEAPPAARLPVRGGASPEDGSSGGHYERVPLILPLSLSQTAASSAHYGPNGSRNCGRREAGDFVTSIISPQDSVASGVGMEPVARLPLQVDTRAVFMAEGCQEWLPLLCERSDEARRTAAWLVSTGWQVSTHGTPAECGGRAVDAPLSRTSSPASLLHPSDERAGAPILASRSIKFFAFLS